MNRESTNAKSQKRARIEDVLNYMENNRTVYGRLKNADFVPFTGAGLAVGIGVGSWDIFIHNVANGFFHAKYLKKKI